MSDQRRKPATRDQIVTDMYMRAHGYKVPKHETKKLAADFQSGGRVMMTPVPNVGFGKAR